MLYLSNAQWCKPKLCNRMKDPLIPTFIKLIKDNSHCNDVGPYTKTCTGNLTNLVTIRPKKLTLAIETQLK